MNLRRYLQADDNMVLDDNAPPPASAPASADDYQFNMPDDVYKVPDDVYEPDEGAIIGVSSGGVIFTHNNYFFITQDILYQGVTFKGKCDFNNIIDLKILEKVLIDIPLGQHVISGIVNQK